MAVIKINNSDEKVIKEFSLYKGIAKVKVLAVNPNLAKLQELGFNFQQEPSYISEVEGVKKVRIDFIIGNETIKSKVTFFLENQHFVGNTSGKTEFINSFGQTSWGNSAEEVTSKVAKNGKKWFKEEGVRPSLKGEADLIKFLSDWLNCNLDDKVYIENVQTLFTGNVTELSQYVKLAENNEIYVLFTVNEKDGKFYQNTESKFFVRASFTPNSARTKFAAYCANQETAGYAVKGFQGLDFGEFSADVKVTTPDADTPKEDDLGF